MFNRKVKIEELFQKEHFVFFFFIFLSFLVFSPTFLNLNFFWDDERFIFLNPSLLQSPGILNFWNPKSVFFKSWPLGYSVFWSLIKFSPFQQIAFYKLINILVHGLNGYLVFKFLKKIDFKYSLIPALFFLIHPLHVESVSWIFQLLTLLSFSFFISSIIFYLNYFKHKKIIYYVTSVLLFSLSIWTKSIAILSPFLYLYFIWHHRNKFRMYLLVIPFFIISLVSGVINLKGVEIFAQKNQINDQWQTSFFNLIDNSINVLTPEDKNTISNNAANMYFQSIYGNFKKEQIQNFNQIIFFKQGLWHYFTKSLFPINLNFIYPRVTIHLFQIAIPLFFLFLVPIYLIFKNGDRRWIFIPIASCTFLAPYLGLTYITFFYWSPVSDRYTYYFLLVPIFVISFIFNSMNRKLHYFIILTLLSFTVLSFTYGTKFNQPEKLYEEIILYKPHPVIYSVLFERYLLDLDLENAKRILGEGMKKFPENSNIQIDRLRYDALEKSLMKTE